MNCNDCHNIHSGEVEKSLEGGNSVCFQCHKDKKGPFVWEHGGVREGCTSCHNPHGSVNKKLLITSDANLCLNCHYEQSYPTFGDRSHTTFIARGKKACISCHEAIHGSNFDPYFHY